MKTLETHQTLKNYTKTCASPELYGALEELALKPKAVQKFQKSPTKSVARLNNGLRPEETKALVMAHTGLLKLAVKVSEKKTAAEFVQTELRDPKLARQYNQVLENHQNDPDGDAKISDWLISKAYDTNAAAVYQAYQELVQVNIETHASNYSTRLDGKGGPSILIQQNQISVNGVVVKNLSYKNSIATWVAADGNASSATLHFQVLTSDDGRPLPAGAYIDSQFYGIFWYQNNPTPTTSNTVGKVGAAPTPDSGTAPVKTTPISTWYDQYTTYLKDNDGKYQKDSTLTVAEDKGDPNGAGITYNGQGNHCVVYFGR